MITDRVNRVLDEESLAYLACVTERIRVYECLYAKSISISHRQVLILRKIKNKKKILN